MRMRDNPEVRACRGFGASGKDPPLAAAISPLKRGRRKEARALPQSNDLGAERGRVIGAPRRGRVSLPLVGRVGRGLWEGCVDLSEGIIPRRRFQRSPHSLHRKPRQRVTGPEIEKLIQLLAMCRGCVRRGGWHVMLSRRRTSWQLSSPGLHRLPGRSSEQSVLARARDHHRYIISQKENSKLWIGFPYH